MPNLIPLALDTLEGLLSKGKNVAKFQDSAVFSQAIRRFIGVALAEGCGSSDGQVFNAALRLWTRCWSDYRRQLKIEFALLFDHVVLKILDQGKILM